MKTINLSVALLLLCSCGPGIEECSRVVFSVGLQDKTRATGISYEDESRINRWCICLFRGGSLAGYGFNESSGDISFDLNPGPYYCCAFVNYPEGFLAETVSSRSLFWETVENLHGNTLSNFMMAGENTITVQPGSSDRISVQVKRLIAKIGIKKITVSLTNPALRNLGFTLDSIYLTGSGATMTGSMVSDTGINTQISHGSSYTEPHYFYADPSGDAGMVIKASIGGTPCYYCFSLGEVRANHSYTVNEVIIRGYGTDGSHDNGSQPDEAEWIIDGQTWGNTYSIDENI